MNASILAVQTFMDMFQGNTEAFGRFVPDRTKQTTEKVSGACSTVQGVITEASVVAHLEGKVGLGVIPVTKLGTCSFVVIDVDIYRKHYDTISIISKYSLPFVPFRSKSGGLHLYIFFLSPSPAIQAIEIASKFRRLLGLDKKTEIFPKQGALSRGSTGNWINLPYFDSDNTARYAMDYSGAPMSLDEALEAMRARRTSIEECKSIIEEMPLSDAPPCLQQLYIRGDTDQRNQYLFSLARYYKAKYGDDFPDKVLEANAQLIDPVEISEVQKTAIKSHTKKDYSYKCNEDPIKSICDKTECKLRKYGVGRDEVSELSYEELTQYITDPPYYTWKVNGKLLSFFSEDEIMNQQVFRRLCIRAIHKMPYRLNDNAWTTIVNTALDNMVTQDIKVEDDISPGALFHSYLVEYLTKRAMATKAEQVVYDKVWADSDGYYYFKPQGFSLFLMQVKQFKYFSQTEVHQRLCSVGGGPASLAIEDGQNLRVWRIPQSSIIEGKTADIADAVLDFDIELAASSLRRRNGPLAAAHTEDF